jgi:cystathionine beta-lyase
VLQQPAIGKVLHPALKDSPGHEIWQRDFTGAASLFSIVFQPHITGLQIDEFVNRLQFFHIGYSWGGSCSLVVPYDMNRFRKKWPYKGGLVRLYIGLEDTEDLIADIKQALSGL